MVYRNSLCMPESMLRSESEGIFMHGLLRFASFTLFKLVATQGVGVQVQS